MGDLFWLTDEQMKRLRPFFPKSHGRPRVDDRPVLSGIAFVNRNGLRWRDTPKNRYSTHSTDWPFCASMDGRVVNADELAILPSLDCTCPTANHGVDQHFDRLTSVN